MHEILDSIQAGDVIFDVGANIGDKAQWFADRGAKVVCVEPQPQMVRQLEARFQSTPNVVIVPKGLGRIRGTTRMSISTASPALSTFADHWKQGRFANQVWDQEVDIDIITLDDLVVAHGVPKYCKIDVEGYELEVIKGLSSKIGTISYEFTSEYITHAMLVLEELIRLGYKEYNVSLGEAPTYYFQDWIPYYEIVRVLLNSSSPDNLLWGDIYAR